MAQIFNTASPPAPRDDESKRRWLLLLLLLFLALITSCVAGYLLGKRAGQKPAGQIIDTILLTPEESAARTMTHITGRIFYSDGSPAAGRHVELHSDPVSTVTDLEGRFLFPNVSFGEHTITVYNQDGSVDAKQPVTISPDKDEQGVIITKEANQGYAITVAVDIRILELVIELDEGQITLLPDRQLYADDRGWITTPSGTASTSSGVIVTPGGAVHLPDGTIVIPSGGGNGVAAVILPDDTVIYPDGQITGDGYTIQPDGTVTLSDETLISPDGTVTLPGAEVQAPGENGVIINNETVMPIGGNASPIQERQTEADSPSETSGVSGGSSPSANPNTDAGPDAAPDSVAPSLSPAAPETAGAPEISGGSESSAGDGGGKHNSGGHGGSHTESTKSTEDSTESTEDSTESTETSTESTEDSTENTGDGELTFWGNVKDSAHYAPWNQGEIIDLFYNRTSGLAEKVAPGSSGFYRFQLKNTLSRELNLTLDISEGQLHLPLHFTLTPLKTNGSKITRQAVSGSITDGKLTLQDKISANEFITYQLDWEWPFAGNDAADTAIGETGGIYTLQLLIHAEEN